MSRNFTDEAFEEYVYWQNQDRKTLKRINKLIDDIARNGADNGIGDPEPLKYKLSGYWSRRIDEKNRLIYRVDENGNIIIDSCKGHYNKD